MASVAPKIAPKFAVPPKGGVPKAKFAAPAPAKLPPSQSSNPSISSPPKFGSTSSFGSGGPPPMPKVPSMAKGPGLAAGSPKTTSFAGIPKAAPPPVKQPAQLPHLDVANGHPKGMGRGAVLGGNSSIQAKGKVSLPPLKMGTAPLPMPKVSNIQPLSARAKPQTVDDAILVRSQIARRPSEPPPVAHIKKAFAPLPKVPVAAPAPAPLARRPSEPLPVTGILKSSKSSSSLSSAGKNAITPRETPIANSGPNSIAAPPSQQPPPMPSLRSALMRRPSEPVPPSHIVRNTNAIPASPKKNAVVSPRAAFPASTAVPPNGSFQHPPLQSSHSNGSLSSPRSAIIGHHAPVEVAESSTRPVSPPPPTPLIRSASKDLNDSQVISQVISPRESPIPGARKHSSSNPPVVQRVQRAESQVAETPKSPAARRPSMPPPMPRVSSNTGAESSKSVVSPRGPSQRPLSPPPQHISFADKDEVREVSPVSPKAHNTKSPRVKPLPLSSVMDLPPPMSLPPPPAAYDSDEAVSSESEVESSSEESSPPSSLASSRSGSALPASLPPSLPVPPSTFSTLPSNLPSAIPAPVAVAGKSASTASTLPPPPAAVADTAKTSPISSPSSKKKDKKEDKKEKGKEDKKEKEKEKDKKKKDKDDKKKKDKEDKKSKTKTPKKGASPAVPSPAGTPRSDSSGDSLTKEERKKQEEEAEEAAFSATFDKTSFLYNRCKNFAAPEQLEGKYKMKTTSWHDRHLVLYCDFILYYEPKSGSVPRDFDKPLGALPLDSIVFKKVKDFEDRMDLTGLIPKTISYENCFEVPIATPDGKERIVLLQFDTEATKNTWRERIKAQAKNISAFKSKVGPELKSTIEVLANKFPITMKLKESPYPGEEEKWIATIKDHWNARNKHRKDLRRAQLFSDFYIPNYRAYIDWFVTSGGEAGVASLEKELMIAEDSVIANWKKEFTSSIDVAEREIDEVDKDNEVACHQLLQKVQRKVNLIRLHIRYYKEVYPTREAEAFEEEMANWTSLEGLVRGYIKSAIDTREQSFADQVADAEAKRKQAEVDRLRREEERRNDPFGGGDDDDPFADVKIVGF